jgi:hypothetical protein
MTYVPVIQHDFCKYSCQDVHSVKETFRITHLSKRTTSIFAFTYFLKLKTLVGNTVHIVQVVWLKSYNKGTAYIFSFR